MEQILVWILTVLIMIAPQLGIDSSGWAKEAGLSDDLQAVIENATPPAPFPEVLYVDKQREIVVGSFGITVRSAVVDLHCANCGTLNKEIAVNLYVKNKTPSELSTYQLLNVALEGTYAGVPGHSWSHYLWETVPAGATVSASVNFEVPLAASDFTFTLASCDPNDRYSWGCDAQHVPATPVLYRFALDETP